MERAVLHSDLNNFYASVETLDHPEYRDIPIIVCGDVEKRHGIVLAKNELAKKTGIKTGMAIWQAKQLCPEVLPVRPHMERYVEIARAAREIYKSYTDMVEPFGMDECWLDVTGSASLFGSGAAIAEEIRGRIRKELGVTVSVGVSFNKVFAKLGSDYKKPDAVTLFGRDNYKELVWPIPARDLLFVGPATGRKLDALGINTIGDIAMTDEKILRLNLGKMGSVLHCYANGLDGSPVSRFYEPSQVKSIGNSTTPPRDICDNGDAKLMIYSLADSVGARLRKHGFRCSVVELWVRDSELGSFVRQKKLDFPTLVTSVIANEAYGLFLRNYSWRRPVRSLGVRVTGLSLRSEPRQLTFFRDELRASRLEELEDAVDRMRDKYGFYSLARGISMSDATLPIQSPDDARLHNPSFYEIKGQR